MALATEATLDMRTYKLSSSLLTLSFLLPGCALFSIDPDEIDVADEVGEAGEGVEETDQGGTTGDESGMTGVETTAADAGTTGDGSDTSGDESGTTDTTGSGTDSGTSDTGTSGSDGCEGMLGETECESCVLTSCCDAFLACESDEVCVCTLDCLAAGQSAGECESMCGPANGLVDELGVCTATNCAAQCS